MLKLTLLPDEYVTINGDIVVQLCRVAGGRADVAVHADRSVPIVRGEVLLQDNKCSATTYTCCANATQGIYYYRSYANSQLTGVRLTEENKNRKSLSIFPKQERQQILFLN